MKELATDKNKQFSVAKRACQIIATLAFFFFSIKLMVTALGGFAPSFQENILSSSLDPFIGLFIGLLVTAIIQSSSTTSTMAVALVATGNLTIQEAIPVIMGANIGTTLTSTIVALGFISDKEAFRKAVSAGVIHDFYNIILVLILFPLEYFYGFLSGISIKLQQLIFGSHTVSSEEGWKWFLDFGITDSIAGLVQSNVVLMLLSFVLLFTSIKMLTSFIQKTVIGDSKNKLRKFVFQKPVKSFGWGMLITSAIQSSSVSTSLLVPLVATRKIRLINAFPFIIGANLGTTLTALIAASFSSEAAMSIAIAHLLFNLTGAVLFMISSGLRRLLVGYTKEFSVVMSRKRIIGLAYVIITFFLLPFLLISINKALSSEDGSSKQEVVRKESEMVN
ncbi:Na/Pi symporter [Roseivirga sp. E12]|uniref:Na/Pi symporter n=1 Tax=Roseivirga sp. E12 TaxID=2819237 RepID=UPI001ABCD5BD|nr:Na/Pi symporter [Roseivirga sp. E12]MBO3699449.1 Na/Pi cotransporter family protein [Roseivirga sp. E12]